MSGKRVGVKATFSVRGKTVHEFSSSGEKGSPAAAAAGVGQQVRENADFFAYGELGW